MSVYFVIFASSINFELYEFWSRMGLWPESGAHSLGDRGKRR